VADAISNKTLMEYGFQVAKKELGSEQGPRSPFLPVLVHMQTTLLLIIPVEG